MVAGVERLRNVSAHIDALSSGSIFTPMLVQRERWPGGSGCKGTPLVSPGQQVLPDQPVLRLHQNWSTEARRLGNSAADAQGELIPAGLRGQVTSLTPRGGVIIESPVIRLPCMLGIGRQVAGILTLWQYGLAPAQQVIPPGAILVVPGALSFSLLRQAAISGIAGIIASSIALRDLEGFLRADLVKLLISDDDELGRALAYLPPLTLLFTAGLGAHAMPAQFVALLSRYQGSIALLNARTSLHRQLFPELLISLPEADVPPNLVLNPFSVYEIALGALVYVHTGPHTGILGIVDYLFVYAYPFPSGVRQRAARVQCEDGSYIIVPLSVLSRLK